MDDAQMKTSPRLWFKPGVWVDPPYLCVYRNRFSVQEHAVMRFAWSADEIAVLYLDDGVIARGPERGCPEEWYFHAVELELAPGEHTLCAAVYCFGKTMTAYAQSSHASGFYFCEKTHLVTAPWEFQIAAGAAFLNVRTDWGSFPHILTDETFDSDIFAGTSGVWRVAETFEDSRNPVPAGLPPHRLKKVSGIRQTGCFWSFPEYGRYYGDYIFSGHGEVRLRWAEIARRDDELPEEFALRHKPGDPFACFSGPGDRIRVDGKKVHWRDYWWHAGRTLEITLFGDVICEQAVFYETGFAWSKTPDFTQIRDPREAVLLKKSWKTLDNCTHDTLMDCPYYEQMPYIGDSRIDFWSIAAATGDLRIIEKSLRMWMYGQDAAGWMHCVYPLRDMQNYTPHYGERVGEHIPSFSLIWVMLIHDFALLKPQSVLLPALADSALNVARFFASYRNLAGVLHVPGWNFIDWLPNWANGYPPECAEGEGATLNLMFLCALKNLADLFRHLKRDCSWLTATAGEVKTAIQENFWIEAKQGYAENARCNYFSEHAQVWALLADDDRRVIPLLESGKLDQCGIAFSFYYLLAARHCNMPELFARRKERYLALAEDTERQTLPELFPNEWWLRSDCHAWGSHFLHWNLGKRSPMEQLSK